MSINVFQLHLPEGIGVGHVAALKLRGRINCSICGLKMSQADIDAEDLVAITGKRAYVAHVRHFYRTNPTTGLTEETETYSLNMRKLAIAYGEGEGLQKGPVM